MRDQKSDRVIISEMTSSVRNESGRHLCRFHQGDIDVREQRRFGVDGSQLSRSTVIKCKPNDSAKLGKLSGRDSHVSHIL